MTDNPVTNLMSTNAEEELYRVLLETANEAPLEVVANCLEVMSTVLNKRLHDLVPEEDDPVFHTQVCEHGFFKDECQSCFG